MRKKYWSLSIIIFLFALTGMAVTPYSRPLLGFEEKQPLRGCYVQGKAVDHDKQAGRIAISSQWHTQGKNALKINFDRYIKGPSWRVLTIKLNELNMANWQGFDAFEADLYNPTKSNLPEGMRFMVRKAGKRIFQYCRPLPPGLFKLKFDLNKPNYPSDLTNLTDLTIAWRMPARDVELLVDNLRLVDYTPVWLCEMVKKLQAAGNTTKVQQSLQSMQQLKKEYTKDLPLKKRLELRSKAKTLIDKANVLLRELAKQQIRQLSKRLNGGYKQLLAIVKSKKINTAKRLSASNKRQILQLIKTVEGNYELLTTMIQREKAESELRQQLKRYRGMAIGVSRYPVARTADAPFSGSFGKTVKIQAAGRESTIFQLVVFPLQGKLENVHYTVSDLTGPTVLPASVVEVAPMGWRQHPEDFKWRADMLRPDIKNFSVLANTRQPIWVTVTIPPRTKPGKYHGKITIAADKIVPVSVPFVVKVLPFTLPRITTLKTASSAACTPFLGRYRFNPGGIYNWGKIKPDLETMRKLNSEYGMTMFNLQRISRMGRGAFCRDAAGFVHYSEARKRIIFKRVDQWIADNVKNESDRQFVRENCFFYGFDEFDLDQTDALEEVYGELKKRYNNMRTAAAINVPVRLDLKNLDIWMAIPDFWKRNRAAIPGLKSRGREIWWYNLFADNRDPISCRIQFWMTYKDKFDGVLHWSLGRGCPNPYGSGLYPPSTRPLDPKVYPWGGLVRYTKDKKPISSVAFEYWRQGIQDFEYLAQLDKLADRLAASPQAKKYKLLIERARYLTRVPEKLTAGLLNSSIIQKKEITLGFSNTTRNMVDIETTKSKVAQLITEISKILNSF